MDQIMPFLMGIVILVVLWTFRVAAKRRSDARCLDLRRATYLMRSNADLTKRVLENPHVPKILKRSLISFSDALTDRAIALEVARGLPGNLQGQLSPRAGDREGAAAGLQKNDPMAFAEFADAAMTAIFAAMLRWPETAAYFPEISTIVAADPQRDVGAVKTAFRFSEGTAKSPARPQMTAIA